MAILKKILYTLLLIHPWIANSLATLNQHSFGVLAPYMYARQKILGDTDSWTKNLYDLYLKKFYKESIFTKESFNNAIRIFCNNNYIDSSLDSVHQKALYLLNNKNSMCNKALITNQSVDDCAEFLAPELLDAMAYEYTKLKSNIFIATIFPTASHQFENIIVELGKHFDILLSKKIIINHDHASLFIQMLYEGEKWLGTTKNQFKGAREKAALCYPSHTKKNPTYIVLFESDSLDSVIRIKKQIRQSLKQHNHSLHINDTHNEAVRMAQTIFNENSLHFINHAKQKNYKNFEHYFHDYKKMLKHPKINPEAFCVDSSAVLSCYGLRDCNDLDFLHHNEDKLLAKLCSKDINSHNQEAPYYPVSIDTILFNPKYHFYHRGVKFSSLEIVQKMKKRRNEQKDRHDQALIQTILT